MSQSSPVKAAAAALLFERHLGSLPHPDGLVRLVQFSHDSPGLRVYKRRIAEALVLLLESNGLLICNGLDECATALRDAGYAVASPTGTP